MSTADIDNASPKDYYPVLAENPYPFETEILVDMGAVLIGGVLNLKPCDHLNTQAPETEIPKKTENVHEVRGIMQDEVIEMMKQANNELPDHPGQIMMEEEKIKRMEGEDFVLDLTQVDENIEHKKLSFELEEEKTQEKEPEFVIDLTEGTKLSGDVMNVHSILEFDLDKPEEEEVPILDNGEIIEKQGINREIESPPLELFINGDAEQVEASKPIHIETPIHSGELDTEADISDHLVQDDGMPDTAWTDQDDPSINVQEPQSGLEISEEKTGNPEAENKPRDFIYWLSHLNKAEPEEKTDSDTSRNMALSKQIVESQGDGGADVTVDQAKTEGIYFQPELTDLEEKEKIEMQGQQMISLTKDEELAGILQDAFLAAQIENNKDKRRIPVDHRIQDEAKNSLTPLEVVSETMAVLYARQGNPQKAILIYKKLIDKFPEKSGFFASQIERLTKL